MNRSRQATTVYSSVTSRDHSLYIFKPWEATLRATEYQAYIDFFTKENAKKLGPTLQQNVAGGTYLFVSFSPHVYQDDGDRNAVEFSRVGHEAPLASPGGCCRQERSQDVAASLTSDRDDVVRHCKDGGNERLHTAVVGAHEKVGISSHRTLTYTHNCSSRISFRWICDCITIMHHA